MPLVVLKHFSTRDTADSLVTWKKFVKQLAYLVRYNKISCQIKWDTNDEYAECCIY